MTTEQRTQEDAQANNGATAGNGFGLDDASLQRAEEIVDRLVQRMSLFATRAGHQMQKYTARAREEAEDFWAEVQQIRKGTGDTGRPSD